MALKEKTKKPLLAGNEIVVKAALAAGADMFSGYPITPSTEILAGWAKEAEKNHDLEFLQMEDEPAAGFALIGGLSVGRKAFTATAGVGHVLMQDPLSMAEAMRFPAVVYIGQRGGPSTGTVIFSQQELNLARSGGNGEGLRIVYAPSNLQELYDFTIKAFNAAWKYRFPTYILSDGYLGKTLGEVNLWQPKKNKLVKPESYFLNSKKGPQNLRNCYSQEKEIYNEIVESLKDYGKMAEKVREFEGISNKGSEILICAWGTIGNSAKSAVEELQKEGINIDLFRPITMKPFSDDGLRKMAKDKKKILILEAAQGQFGRIIREVLYENDTCDAEIYRLYKPAMGIVPEEIEAKIKEMLDD